MGSGWSFPVGLTGRLATKRKPATSKTITVKIILKKLIIPAAALVAIVIALLIFFPRNRASLSQTGVSGIPSVAILYFKNNTGDKNLEIWREGLSLSLITKLSQSRYIRVLDQSQIYSVLKRLNLLKQDNFTPEDLKEIASRGLASHIVRGSLSKAGERFRIDLTLQSASTLEIIAPESADGTGEESLFAMVDGLADRLKTNLGLTEQQAATDVSREIRDVTTSSSEAFKFYVQGQQLYNAGEFMNAISYFEKSVAADPQFAMAYLWMGLTYWVRGPWKEMRFNLQKAFDLRERVSEREHLLIEAEYFQRASEKTWGKSIDSFSKLITLYPWDLRASGDLAFLYWMMDEWDEAIKRYEVVRRYKDESQAVYQMLAWCYLCKGQPDKAREVLEGYLNTIGDNAFIRGNLGLVYCIQEDYEKAGTEFEKACAQNPETVGWWRYFFLLCIEDFVSAEQLLKEMESSQPVFSIGLRSASLILQGKIKDAVTSYKRELDKWQAEIDPLEMAQYSLDFAGLLDKTGDFSGALSACETGLRKARESGNGLVECYALYLRGVLQARAGNFQEAERSAEELRRAVESGLAKKRFRYSEALLGVISLQKKDLVSAQDHLQKAISLTSVEDGYWHNPQTEFLDYLAQSYIQAGRWAEAKTAYEDVLSHKLRSLLWGWSPGASVFSRSYYKLGIVLERLGDKDGAVKNYRKFLDLWKDADPGLPEAEDAKKRLGALT